MSHIVNSLDDGFVDAWTRTPQPKFFQLDRVSWIDHTPRTGVIVDSHYAELSNTWMYEVCEIIEKHLGSSYLCVVDEDHRYLLYETDLTLILNPETINSSSLYSEREDEILPEFVINQIFNGENIILPISGSFSLSLFSMPNPYSF